MECFEHSTHEQLDLKQVTGFSFWISGNLTSEKSWGFTISYCLLSGLFFLHLCTSYCVGTHAGSWQGLLIVFSVQVQIWWGRLLCLSSMCKVPCTSDKVKTSIQKIHIWLGHSPALGVYMFSMYLTFLTVQIHADLVDCLKCEYACLSL